MNPRDFIPGDSYMAPGVRVDDTDEGAQPCSECGQARARKHGLCRKCWDEGRAEQLTDLEQSGEQRFAEGAD